jgi:hypothetical protein
MVHSSPSPTLARIPVHLTLLVPELIWPEPADQFTLGKLSAPGLEWLLARARLERRPRQPYETALTGGFGLAAAPCGALRLLGEGNDEARSGHWLCADPVHLRFHQERIILADAGAFDLADDEAHAIVAALNAEFADIGQFHVASARRWYLQLAVAVDHPVAPISAVAGRRVDGEITGSALPLTRWLNEVQMFLHGLPVNEQRQAAGQPVINSLWLWGGGTLQAPAAPEFSAVFSNNPLAAGLARACDIPLYDRPATLADVLAQGGKQPLVVLDQLLSRVLYEDGDGWRSDFEQMESNWFTPLKKALGSKVDRISLIAPTVYGELRYTVTGGDRWKLWKRGKPIVETAKELAQ